MHTLPGTCQWTPGSPRAGASLVEVLVSIVILFIVFCSWAAMNNIQAVRRESFRYAAVEKAAGMLDAISRDSVGSGNFFTQTTYWDFDKLSKLWEAGESDVDIDDFEEVGTNDRDPEDIVLPMWKDSVDGELAPTIGYRLYTTYETRPGWQTGYWVTLDLYDDYRVADSATHPFTTLGVFVYKR